MGTKATLFKTIRTLRETVQRATEKGGASKKKLLGVMMLEGHARRGAVELIQSFIDAEEWKEVKNEVTQDIVLISLIMPEKIEKEEILDLINDTS